MSYTQLELEAVNPDPPIEEIWSEAAKIRAANDARMQNSRGNYSPSPSGIREISLGSGRVFRKDSF